MNGVGSVGSEGSINRVPRVTSIAEEQAAENQPWKRVGMEDALKLSGQYIKDALNEDGFVDIHAGSVAMLQMYVEHQSARNEPPEIGLDPVSATEIAAYMGKEIASDVNRALRIIARVDPARVAALLK